MSIELMSQVYRLEVDALRQRVLLVLADMANDHGVCWPSIGLVAWKLGVSDRSVQRTMTELEELRALTRSSRPGMQTLLYKLDLGALPTKDLYTPKPTGRPQKGVTPEVNDDAVDEKGGDTGGVKGVTPEVKGVTPEVKGGDTCVTQTISEPSIEPSEKHQPRKRGKARLTPLPEDFALTDDLRDYALSKGVADPDDEFEGFCLWVESKGETSLNWRARLQNWFREAGRRAATAPAGGRSGAKRVTSPVAAGIPAPATVDRAAGLIAAAAAKAEADRRDRERKEAVANTIFLACEADPERPASKNGLEWARFRRQARMGAPKGVNGAQWLAFEKGALDRFLG